MNIINGKLIRSKNDLKEIENFIERWTIKSHEIRKISLNGRLAHGLFSHFLEEFMLIIDSAGLEKHNKMLLLYQLTSDVKLALFIAHSNYIKQHKFSWDRLKLPPINISGFKL